MTTALRALSVRDDLRSLVTALLPVLSLDPSIDVEVLRERYAGVLSGFGLDTESERDMALMAGAVEVSLWVIATSELADVPSVKLWQSYVSRLLGD